LDNHTRWNSCWEMLNRLVISKVAIAAALATKIDAYKQNPNNLMEEDWALIKEILAVLRPFKECTDLLSQEKYPSLGLVMPMMNNLLENHLKLNLFQTNSSNSSINDLKSAIKQDLDAKWKSLTLNASAAVHISILLDPRVKNYSFIRDDKSRSSLLNIAKIHTLQQLSLMFPGEREEKVQYSKKSEKHKSLFGEEFLKLNQSKKNSLKDELKKYMEVETIPLLIPKKENDDEDDEEEEEVINNILVWWKVHENEFPHLAELARKYLCIGATSVSCERVFSKSGWIVSKRRSCLSDKNVGILTFISCNMHYLEN